MYYPLSIAIKNNLNNFITPKDYDIIISDTELENRENFKKNYEDIQWKDIVKAISYYSEHEKYNSIVLVLEHNTIDPLINLLTKFPKQKNITILDLHSGVFAWGEKSTPSQYAPYSLEDYGFEIITPIDEYTFHSRINEKTHTWWKKYFAIPDLVLPENLTKKEKFPIIIHYETENKNAHTGILTIWYPYIQVGQLLQQKNIKNITLLISDTINLNKKSLSHIKEFNNLIIIIDSKHPDIIKKNIQAQLYTAKIFDIKLKVITPKYEKLTTILKDYQLQETEFDTEWLAQQLNLW